MRGVQKQSQTLFQSSSPQPPLAPLTLSHPHNILQKKEQEEQARIFLQVGLI